MRGPLVVYDSLLGPWPISRSIVTSAASVLDLVHAQKVRGQKLKCTQSFKKNFEVDATEKE